MQCPIDQDQLRRVIDVIGETRYAKLLDHKENPKATETTCSTTTDMARASTLSSTPAAALQTGRGSSFCSTGSPQPLMTFRLMQVRKRRRLAASER